MIEEGEIIEAQIRRNIVHHKKVVLLHQNQAQAILHLDVNYIFKEKL